MMTHGIVFYLHNKKPDLKLPGIFSSEMIGSLQHPGPLQATCLALPELTIVVLKATKNISKFKVLLHETCTSLLQ